jgi:hypothetical protein
MAVTFTALLVDDPPEIRDTEREGLLHGRKLRVVHEDDPTRLRQPAGVDEVEEHRVETVIAVDEREVEAPTLGGAAAARRSASPPRRTRRATSPQLEGIGGGYFADCNEPPIVDPSVSPAPRGFGVAAYALDPDKANRLMGDVAPARRPVDATLRAVEVAERGRR